MDRLRQVRNHETAAKHGVLALTLECQPLDRRHQAALLANFRGKNAYSSFSRLN